MEKVIRSIIARHKERDEREGKHEGSTQEAQYVATLKQNVKKIRTWLKENDDKPGKTGKPIKSNITDNESATMKTSHGVVQGYDGVAVVDGKHQIIVRAEAYGAPRSMLSCNPWWRAPWRTLLLSAPLTHSRQPSSPPIPASTPRPM